MKQYIRVLFTAMASLDPFAMAGLSLANLGVELWMTKMLFGAAKHVSHTQNELVVED